MTQEYEDCCACGAEAGSGHIGWYRDGFDGPPCSLVAAAPDLLAAAEAVAPYVAEPGGDFALDRLRNAIARAKGETA